MVSTGTASSSVIVPVALDDVPSVALPPAGEANVTTKVSSSSSSASCVVCTSTVVEVLPASMVAVLAVVTAV